MRVLVAPDCFTGTLTAGEAAGAVAAGWRSRAPRDEVRELPLSDGGPGLVEVVAAALGGEAVPVVVEGPAGDPVPASVLVVPAADDPSGRRTGYVESAQACGLHLVPGEARGRPGLSTRGVGDLVAAAVATGAERLVVGLGGSGTVDGGEGMLGALGGVASGRALLEGVDLLVASDVDAPLLGAHGAVNGYGLQKGVPARELAAREEAMRDWAAVLVDEAGRAGLARAERLPVTAGAGAAGGLGAALLALGGRREPGAQVVADLAGLDAAAAGADLVVTGEGSFDWQSLRGKVVTAAARAAQRAAVPVVVVAGQVLVGRRELASAGVDAAYAVVEGAVTLDEALADPAGTLAARAARVAGTWSRVAEPVTQRVTERPSEGGAPRT